MTPHAPTPLPPYSSATRTRVKWDNIAIVLFGVVVAAFAVVGILASGETTPATAPKRTVEPAQTAPPLEDAASENTLTLAEAQGLVDESRSLMAEARWDEAADRLAMVPAEFRDSVGVPALEQELAATRATHERVRAELTAAVEARQWKQARILLTKLERIAPLDTELLAIQAQVNRALAPPAAAPKVEQPTPEADAAADATATGGGAAANATKPKPAAQSTRPANTTSPRPAAQRPKPAATNPATPQPAAGTPGIQLTAEQQQELEAALAAIDSSEVEGL